MLAKPMCRAGSIEWFAEEAKRIYGDIIPVRDLPATCTVTVGTSALCVIAVYVDEVCGTCGCNASERQQPHSTHQQRLGPAESIGHTVVRIRLARPDKGADPTAAGLQQQALHGDLQFF